MVKLKDWESRAATVKVGADGEPAHRNMHMSEQD
jgi:hypothetical protein